MTAYSHLVSDATSTTLRPLGRFNPAMAKCDREASFETSYKLIAMLVHCEVNSSVRAPPYLLLDIVLVDSMDGTTIILTIRVLRMCM